MRADLKVGDFVKIVAKDGRQLEFEIVAISSDALFSAYQVIQFNEIAQIEKIKINENETTERKAQALWKYWEVASGIILMIAVAIGISKAYGSKQK